MIRTFLDADVLIAVTNLTDAVVFERIERVLYDERREFVCNDFLKLEVLPKPTRNKRQASVDFCERYFRNCAHHVETNGVLLEVAFIEACRLGLSATDAIHIASAHIAQSQELITLEKPTKPMHKSKLVKVVYLHDVQ